MLLQHYITAQKNLLRVVVIDLDMIAIYVLIAGSYTPYALVMLKGLKDGSYLALYG
ncbi:MAG: hypothetical protein Ct9H90mP15_06050 [Candidatus Neomarinimicrobiota bacterium]|nr:MAG: hypothetical protein Ct9H90mP15_06050 [Candidatus Neomarinimicrobiota bacterium]